MIFDHTNFVIEEKYLTNISSTNNITDCFLATEKDIDGLLFYNIPLLHIRRSDDFFSVEVDLYLLRPVNGVYQEIKSYGTFSFADYASRTYAEIINDITNEDKQNIKLFLLHRNI